MASHRSPESAPADDQAFSESFDEDKTGSAADQRRPDRDKADGPVQPLDMALDGAQSERFGETVNDEQPLRRRESAADQARDDGLPSGPKPEGVRPPDDPEDAKDSDEDGDTQDPDEKIDEAMEESFPASDPPPVRPGEP